MITAFEQRLLETIFPEYSSWSSVDSLASYVMHRGNQQPIFFRELTDEVLEYALTHEKEYSVFAVQTNGGVDDVTEAWTRVFEKHKSTLGALDALVEAFAKHVPENIATLEVKGDGITLGYFPKPSRDVVKCVDRVRDVNRLTVLIIQTNGVVKDITSEVLPYFKDYVKLRVKGR